MDKNTQQPAWWHARINGAHDAFFNELPPDDAYDEGTLTALYTAPTVPRDVLMAAMENVREAIIDVYHERIGHQACIEKKMRRIDLDAIADRYASQVRPESVKQQPASAQPVAVPEGWQLVPKEPTRAMLDAAHTNFRKDIEIDPLLKTSYRAMLSAAQKQEGV